MPDDLTITFTVQLNRQDAQALLPRLRAVESYEPDGTAAYELATAITEALNENKEH